MTGYKDYTVKQLQEQLRNRGLQIGGRKADLVRRLEEDDKKSSNVSKGDKVDREGTDNISRDNAGSSPTGKVPVALETLGIHLKHYCPEDTDQYSNSEMVQQLFELVWYSRDIRSRTFGTKLRGKDTNNENKAERSYDLNLKKRAAELARDCKDTKMCDALEAEWTQLLSP